jgi:asparagine synthase (glutamine-hydrolysing)
MVVALEHRGPDGNGMYFFDTCALGHTRLAIVDVDGGKQPMWDRNEETAITFNGEIYGYRVLRDQLSDYPFRTSCDTEVLLALYERYGRELLPHVPGMFAFALWDDPRQELVCGRDRFGEKPFYYALGPAGEFVFASEIKALLASGLVEPILDRSQVARYLARLCVDPYRTIYKNIHVLPPAHRLCYRDGKIHLSRYWQMPATDEAIKIDDAVERFGQLFESAVERQLIADVPVGAFLSGGLDSTSIVVAARQRHNNLKTFSFDFEGTHSEIHFARAVAVHCQTDHVELKCPETDIAELLEEMQYVYDEPFADSSNIPTYILARLARQHVKSVLTGDGGDELLGGYDWYRPLYWMACDAKRGFWRALLLRAASRIARELHLPTAARAEAMSRGVQLARRFRSPLEAHRQQSLWFQPRHLEQLGLEPHAHSLDSTNGNGYVETVRGNLDDVMRSDIADYMAGDILTKIDRASMAHGLELRAPFLDVEFASFCISLPFRLKLSADTDKLALRLAYAAQWPEMIRNRHKQGFGAPVGRWLRTSSLDALRHDTLDQPHSRLFDLLPFDRVQKYLRDNDYKTWILLVLALWMEKHPCRLA